MADAEGAQRTFIALPLPVEWTTTLESVIGDLQGTTPRGVRWVRPSGIHLTLKFLGSTDVSKVPRILYGLDEAMNGAQSPHLALSRLGIFPNSGNPRVLWAGVTGELDILEDLQQRVEALTVGLGWVPERRPFRPHLTIGRVRDNVPAAERLRIAAAVTDCTVPRLAPWRPGVVRLYLSELTPRGAIYSNLGEVAI